MNRTTVIFAVAALLAVLALSFGSARSPTAPVQPATAAAPQPSGAPVAALTSGPVLLEARLSHGLLAPGSAEVFAQVSLTGQSAGVARERKPVNLAVIIDRSGSMSGEKIERAKEAARHLVSLLGPSDRLAVVDYSDYADHLAGAPATPANKEVMLSYIDRIRDGGSTNIGAALLAAQGALQEGRGEYAVNRAILLSDGEPTAGIVQPAPLLSLAGRLREAGVAVSAIGVGTSFNESLMTGLAEVGGGFYGYLRDGSQLARIFGRELDYATSVVARQVQVTLEVPAGVELLDVFGRAAPAGARTVTFPVEDLAAGHSAKVLARLRVLAPAGEGRLPLLTARVAYVDVAGEARREAEVVGAAQLVADAGRVQSGIVEEVFVAGTRALGAVSLRQAADAYQSGRREEADGLLGNVRALFAASANALGGSDELDQGLADLDATQQRLQGATGDDLRHLSMEAKRKGLADFGQNSYGEE